MEILVRTRLTACAVNLHRKHRREGPKMARGGVL